MQNLIPFFKKYGIQIDENQQKQFDLYFSHLFEANKVTNLTAITEEKEVAIKHFLDSTLPEKLFPQNASVVDVGSGAGFPALPLKIVRPDLEICMVDSLNKRVNFLNEVLSLLNFSKTQNISKNIHPKANLPKDESLNKNSATIAVHARAEDFAKENRERFDVAVARAVAPLNTLVEYLLPLVKLGGCAIIYKSAKLEEELELSKNAISMLGGKVEKIEKYKIDEEGFEIMERNILVVRKISKTPSKFPRSGNKPRLSPIK